MGITWSDEGPVRYQGKPIKYLEEAAQLRSNPGKWATIIVAETPNAAWCHATAIKTGRRAAFRPARSFEAACQDCAVLVRYIGNPEGAVE